MNSIPRFQEQAEGNVSLMIGTYWLNDLIYIPTRMSGKITTQDEIDKLYFAVVEFDLERAPDCPVEIMRVKAYSTSKDHKEGRPTPLSASLQEDLSSYLQDDKSLWSEACAWLSEMGEPISVKGDALPDVWERAA